MRELERGHVPYRLIDSGQHGAFSEKLRKELGIRRPDYVFGNGRDVATVAAAIRWSLRILGYLIYRNRLRNEVFPGGVVCVVHGDTPSTFLAALLCRRAGLDIAHVEAGYRSFSYRSPFPEELIRVVVMKMSTILFASSAEAYANLQAMRLKGQIVRVSANTVIESLGSDVESRGVGPVVITLHRVENLHRPSRLVKLLDLMREIADAHRVLFVVHPPTEQAIAKNKIGHVLRHRCIEVRRLLPHDEFVRHLRRAPFVITDGGSIQQECSAIGVPTLLWRDRTESIDGLGANVVVSRFDDQTISDFLAHPEKYRRTPADITDRPSTQIVDNLLEMYAS